MHRIESDAAVPMDAAYLGLNCNHLEIQGQLWLGSGEIDGAHDVHISGLLDGGSGLIDVGGNWINAGTFIAATGSVRLSGGCKSDPVVIGGPTTFCRLDLGGSGENYQFDPGAQIVVDCELDLGNDNSLSSSGPEETYIALGPGATVVGSARLNGVRIGSRSLPTAIPSLSPMALAGLVFLLAIATVCSRRKRRVGVGTTLHT